MGQRTSQYGAKTVFTNDDIVDVSTYLEISTGLLTIGKRYEIKTNTTGNFTNVGAADNNVGTIFIATGTTPTAWGNGVLFYYVSEKSTINQLRENLRGYKVYRALITQAGTNAPVATILENTLGVTITYSYVATGDYKATASGAIFLSGKTALIGGDCTDDVADINGKLAVHRESDTIIRMQAKVVDSGISQNDFLFGTLFEIIVYN